MNGEGIHIRGVGAVTAAGWSTADLLRAVREGNPLPTSNCARPGDERPWPCATRLVPPPPPEKAARHPRLRRASAITRYSVSAALEAMSDAGHDPAAPPKGLGILFTMMNGCVNYTGRFYQEVLQNPAQASPLIFPETVFNAPASHIASFLGVDGAVSTLVGSSNTIMEAFDAAACWLHTGLVEECLLIAAEECDWLSAEALTYYHPKLVASEGAAALLLSTRGDGPQVRDVIGPLCYTTWDERTALLPDLARQTKARIDGASVLINDQCGIPRIDRPEACAWSEIAFQSVRSPKKILGECMGAGSALNLALGILETRETGLPTVVSMPGTNTAAYACVITPA